MIEIFLFLFFHLTFGQNLDPWILTSDEYPDDPRLVPAVGNGHVATQVLSDTIYVNNVYNGYINASHRAKVPSPAGFTVIQQPEQSNYTLLMQHGVFVVELSFAGYSTTQRIYAHRTLTRIIVHELTIRRYTDTTGDVTIQLDHITDVQSDDFNLTTTAYDQETWYTTGPIKEPETDDSGHVSIHMYWDNIPDDVTLVDGEESRSWQFLVSLSIDNDDALSQLHVAKNLSAQDLRDSHEQAWMNLWQTGNISINGNSSLWQLFNAAMFHIYISSPDTYDSVNPFSGLSPGGLARGGVVEPNKTSAYNDYLGHVFWDMDTWIMPAVLMFQPHMAQIMIQSRIRVLGAAADNAADSGYRGVRFPWEQAYTGYEVCPWDLAALYQIHVTADVSYSLRQYLYSTRDSIILQDEGRRLAMDIARFWDSRTTLIDPIKGYEIHGVMGPDEYASNINNSVFTNYNALLSLQLPSYLSKVMGTNFTSEELEEINGFESVAAQMYLPFDEVLLYHPQYEGFQTENATIKQSDVVLLGYPLMKNMTEDVRRNDLEIYEELTDKTGPDTGTWSMHTVGWLELQEPQKAAQMFANMLRNVNGPFKIFSEKPAFSTDGMRATNFITLAGGMLQAVLFGYGGIRLQPYQMDINPYTPPEFYDWGLHGISYRNAKLDLYFDSNDQIIIELTQAGLEVLVLYSWSDCSRYELQLNDPVIVMKDRCTFVSISDEVNAQLC